MVVEDGRRNGSQGHRGTHRLLTYDKVDIKASVFAHLWAEELSQTPGARVRCALLVANFFKCL